MPIHAKISHAAQFTQVGRRTIHRWITQGLITQNADGTVNLLDIEETRERLARAPRRIARDKARHTKIAALLASTGV